MTECFWAVWSLHSSRQSVFAKRFWAPTPNTPNVPINCRDFGMVCLGPVCSSVGARSSGRAYNLRGAIPVIAPLFTFIVKHYANDVPVTLATFPCTRPRSKGFPEKESSLSGFSSPRRRHCLFCIFIVRVKSHQHIISVVFFASLLLISSSSSTKFKERENP